MIHVSSNLYFIPKNSYPPYIGPIGAVSLISSLILAYYSIRLMVQFGGTKKSRSNTFPYEIRKVQDTTRCLLVSIPRQFANWMQLKKGTLLKLQFDSDEQAGNRIIISRVYFKDGKPV